MTNQSVSEFGVHVAGSFQGWNPSSTQLTDDDGDNIYSYLQFQLMLIHLMSINS